MEENVWAVGRTMVILINGNGQEVVEELKVSMNMWGMAGWTLKDGLGWIARRGSCLRNCKLRYYCVCIRIQELGLVQLTW